MTAPIRRFGRPIALCGLGAAFLGLLLTAVPARARVGVFVGVGIAPPVVYPPPIYYSPPVYYPPPPPVMYAPPPPPGAYAGPPPPSPTGQSCYAGPIVCPMQRLGAPGRTCWCTDSAGQRIYGYAG